MQPERWGIQRAHHDHRGEQRLAPGDTIEAIAASMGVSEDGPPPAPVRTVRRGSQIGLRGELVLEEGGALTVDGALPQDIPYGYHELRAEAGALRLVVSPGRCHLPEGLAAWGFSAQLYATRSTRSWGVGDLGDLADLARWARSQGAGVVLVSPLHAPLPAPEAQQPSPYFPSSRCARNPIHLRVEDVPGAASLEDLGAVAAAGRALNGRERIDRQAVLGLKLEALGRIFAAAPPGEDLDGYIATAGPTLASYGAFCAIHEVHGPDWRRWPAELRRPANPAVAALAAERAERVRFHQWLQQQLDRQLAAASGLLAVVHDLALGVDPAGADAWLWQDSFAPGMRAGAPPDEFNQAGQDWGFAPLDPWALRAAAYEPFIQTLRACLRHAGGLRIDHVMGLSRLWWVPDGAPPAAGAYVRYPAAELLDIVALESHRAGAWIVGEDLGTVEPSFRDELAGRGMLSYRLLYFEQEPPSRYPPQALAAVSTHDLPTLAGLFTGADLQRQRALEVEPNVASTAAVRDRLASWAGIGAHATVQEVVAAVHELLAEAPCMVVTATLEDVAGALERPNHPGTQAPSNWSTPLPLALEDLFRSPTAARVIAALAKRR